MLFLSFFLRNDIFDLCRDPDKNKWLDRAITLDWNNNALRSLIAFRLSRAADRDATIKPFEEIWSTFSSAKRIRTQSKHNRQEEILKYMLRSTFNRPRDIINYVRECAKIAIQKGSTLITPEIIKEANQDQSQYMRREIIDEMYAVLDNVAEILDILSQQRKSIFSQKEFETLYNENIPFIDDGRHHLSSSEVLKLLYHFNAIGNVTTGNHQVYSYMSNSKKLNPKENICIHRGILKALDIV